MLTPQPRPRSPVRPRAPTLVFRASRVARRARHFLYGVWGTFLLVCAGQLLVLERAVFIRTVNSALYISNSSRLQGSITSILHYGRVECATAALLRLLRLRLLRLLRLIFSADLILNQEFLQINQQEFLQALLEGFLVTLFKKGFLERFC